MQEQLTSSSSSSHPVCLLLNNTFQNVVPTQVMNNPVSLPMFCDYKQPFFLHPFVLCIFALMPLANLHHILICTLLFVVYRTLAGCILLC